MFPKIIKVVVLGANSEGQPEFYKAYVTVSHEQWKDGDYYDLAILQAKDAGFEGHMIAFTVNDPAGKELSEIADWL